MRKLQLLNFKLQQPNICLNCTGSYQSSRRTKFTGKDHFFLELPFMKIFLHLPQRLGGRLGYSSKACRLLLDRDCFVFSCLRVCNSVGKDWRTLDSSTNLFWYKDNVYNSVDYFFGWRSYSYNRYNLNRKDHDFLTSDSKFVFLPLGQKQVSLLVQPKWQVHSPEVVIALGAL